MADKDSNQNIPKWQQLYDRPFLWLAAGFITMVLFYTAWGIYEIVTLPKGNLP